MAAAAARGLLLRGLSTGRSLLQATATCSTGGSSTHRGAAAWRSAPWGTHGCRGTACSTRGLSLHSPQGNCCCEPGAPPASCCTHLGGCRAASHSLLFQLLLCSSISPCLHLLSQRCKQHRLLAQLWQAPGPFWSYLELAVVWTVLTDAIPAGPCYQTLAT